MNTAAHLQWIVPMVVAVAGGLGGVLVGVKVALAMISKEIEHLTADLAKVHEELRDCHQEQTRLWTALQK